MHNLSEEIKKAKEKYGSLEAARAAESTEQKQLKDQVAIATFKEIFSNPRLSKDLEKIESLPGFEFGVTYLDFKVNQPQGCFYFDLVDEFDICWKADVTYDFAKFVIRVPGLCSVMGAESARQRRSNRQYWQKIYPPGGVSLWETILLVMADWEKKVEALSIEQKVNALKEGRDRLRNRQLKQESTKKYISQQVDYFVDRYRAEKIIAVAKQQDAQIRETIQQQFQPLTEAIAYKWTWCSGSILNEDTSLFDYSGCISARKELDGEGWITDLIEGATNRQKIKIIPKVHRPVVEEITIDLDRIHRSVPVTLVNVTRIQSLYVYQTGATTTFYFKMLPKELDQQCPPSEIVFEPISELKEEDLELLAAFLEE